MLLPTAKLTGRAPFRIVTLAGTPEEIGKKRGKLLSPDIRRGIAPLAPGTCAVQVGGTVQHVEVRAGVMVEVAL